MAPLKRIVKGEEPAWTQVKAWKDLKNKMKEGEYDGCGDGGKMTNAKSNI